nr:ribonuclease H-like domain-containing protein [Tanacetum cinerariifolium]
VENLVPIPSESEDTSRSDSECDLLSCVDFSPIDVPEGKSMTFSNPLFDLNDDFTSSDDESLSDEDVPEDNVLEDIESKASYDSNLDELALLVTPLFDSNEDEYDELSDKELKQIEADDQAIQTILLGLPEDIYAAIDSCETAQEIWLRVQQLMKGSDIGIQEKKAKLFNEWERQYVKRNAGNPAGYNDVIGNQLMRIEQYFLMTDYSIWEVINNGNKVLKKTVGISKQTYEPTSAEEKLDRRNERKAKGTLLMALPNKDQPKFHSYQDAKLLMESIEKMYGGNKESKKRNKAELKTISLDDLYNNLKIYEPKLSGSSNINQNPQNMAFVSSNSISSTNEADTTASGVSTSHTQDKRGREYGRKTVLVETPTENALIAQNGIGGYDWSYQAEEEIPTNYAFKVLTSSGSSLSSDSEVDSCSKSCMKAYANVKEEYDSLTLDYKKSQFNLLSYKACLQSVEERLVHYKKNEAVFTNKINVLNLEVKLKDNVLAEYTKNLKKADKERDELKLTLEKLQNSSNSLNNFLDSQISDKFKAGLRYKEITPDSFVNSSEILEKQENRSDEEYHAVPPPFTGNYMPSKRDLRLIDEHFESVYVDVISNISPSDVKTVKTIDVNHKGMFSIEEPKPVQMMKVRHMTGNKCYLTDFEAYDGGFVSFRNGKGTIYGKGKIKTGKLDFDDVYFCKELKYNLFSVSQMFDKKNNVLFTVTECLVSSFNFKLLDESQVLLSVSRKDNIYSVDLKSVVPTGGIKREYSVARTPQQNEVAERRNRTLIEAARTMDNLGKFEGKTDEGYFVGYSMVSKAIRVFNKRTMIVEETLNIRFQQNAPNVKGNEPDWLFDIDSLTISMNYVPVVAGNQTNGIARSKENLVAGQDDKKRELKQEYILIPICKTDLLISQGTKDSAVDAGKKAPEVDESKALDNGGKNDQVPRSEVESLLPTRKAD